MVLLEMRDHIVKFMFYISTAVFATSNWRHCWSGACGFIHTAIVYLIMNLFVET
jgi:hypothetical protein